MPDSRACTSRVARRARPGTWQRVQRAARIGTVGIYQATEPEAIREHARRVGMPADGITQIVDTVIVRPHPTNE